MKPIKIFIDAGHNYDKWNTGATGNGLREQDITFEISKKLADKLNVPEIEVKLSRNKITDILGTSDNSSINKRVEMANAWEADLFISIHCNSHWLKSATGTESFVYSKNSKAYGLAEGIIKSVSAKLDLKNRGVKTKSSLGVLRKTNMPALLIETAFISNVNDAQKLKDRQNDFVDAISEEIFAWYGIEEKKPIADVPEPATYHIEGITHIVEIDPRNIWGVETKCSTKKVTYHNFVNSIFYAPGVLHPYGIMVNAGKVIYNVPTHEKPVATLVVYGKDNVQLKYIDDITKEKNVWFAVSGYGVCPHITSVEEGFTGKFTDVLRETARPIIGYRKRDNKIVIAVRDKSSATRAQETAKNLGLDFAISLDAGGSTTLKVNGKYKFKGDGRKILAGLIWS